MKMNMREISEVVPTKSSNRLRSLLGISKRVDKSGQPREYVSHLLRRTYRDGARVKHETLAILRRI
jgi:hypothetical protein